MPNDLADSAQLDSLILHEYAENAYLQYAMAVVRDRALPQVEDGQKPVQRRILYAMRQLGLGPATKPVKCARMVGDVLGTLHPHGDTSVYDALVRMAQDFTLRYPLIVGQGNFGSRDGDPRRRVSIHGSEAHADLRAPAGRARPGHGRFHAQLRQHGHRAGAPAGAPALRAAEWLDGYRSGDGVRHSTAQPARSGGRRCTCRHTSRRFVRGVARAHARARLSRRRPGHLVRRRNRRRVPDRTRIVAGAGALAHRGSRPRSMARRGVRAPVSGLDQACARRARRALKSAGRARQESAEPGAAQPEAGRAESRRARERRIRAEGKDPPRDRATHEQGERAGADDGAVRAHEPRERILGELHDARRRRSPAAEGTAPDPHGVGGVPRDDGHPTHAYRSIAPRHASTFWKAGASPS